MGFTQIWYKKLSLAVGVLTFYLNQAESKEDIIFSFFLFDWHSIIVIGPVLIIE